MNDPFVGALLGGHYRLDTLIGKGGQGRVYQATDTALRRPVAVKLLSPEQLERAEAIQAFLRETETIAILEHEHILPVYVRGEQAIDGVDQIYLVMRYAAGGTLAQRIARGPLAPGEAARLLNAVCSALDYAHNRRVLHLDLKPLNILFDDRDNPLLSDFGLAKILETTSHTKADTQAGTRAYMAHEQFFGSDARRQTDIYAIGVMLYEMLTGTLPQRDADNEYCISYPEPLPQALTPAIRAVIDKAAAYKWNQRYSTAGELAEAFAQALGHTPMPLAPIAKIATYSRELRQAVQATPQAPALLDESLPAVADLNQLAAVLRALGEHCEAHPTILEREVVTLAFELGLFQALGYSAGRRDVLLEEQHADVVLRAPEGRPIGVIEFKRPNRSPQDGLEQLENDYVRKLLPDVGALTNGRELWIYRREGRGLQHPAIARITLRQASTRDAEHVYRLLGRRTINLTRLVAFDTTLRGLATAPLEVRGPGDAGGLAFLDRLALRRGTPFGRLVGAMYEALPPMLQRSAFTTGAYNFWRRIYARSLDMKDTPKSWRAFMSSGGPEEELYRFMFALESAYAVASRLLLARAMENQQFPDVNLADVVVGQLRRHQRQGRLPPAAYVDGVRALFDAAGNQAFQAIFASDIFDWWHDLWDKREIQTQEYAGNVGERLAEAMLAIVGFDFRPMSGDLLGGLYQSYFDPETRKALGEFYTPPEVVDFILDQVEYTPAKINTVESRLLDPSCGSGTFLVHALQRYLKAAAGQPPARVLQDLLGGLKIVGFDVNPFAVLMAQANYAAQIIPLYAQALQRGDVPVAYAIPVLRTDSLRQEYREGEQAEGRPGENSQSSFFAALQTENVTIIRAELPVEVARGTFFQAEIPVPRYDSARSRGWVGNQEDYFAVLRVLFEAVGDAQTSVEALRSRLEQIGRRQFAQELAHYLQPAVEKLVATLHILRSQYDDGRFLKTLADLALALVLKNDVSYSHVVANPPYIRVQEIPAPLREQWLSWYGWAEGNFDAYVPFMERAISVTPRATGPRIYEWLQPGGRFGLICSNRFMLANYAATMRAELPKKAAIDLLVDFRDSRVFEDALNYPAILVARRLHEAEPQPEQFVAVRVFDDPRTGAKQLLDEAETLIDAVRGGAEYVHSATTDAFPTATADLRKQAWLTMPPSERQVFHKLEAAATIERPSRHALFKELPQIARAGKPYIVRLEYLTLTQSGAFQGVATGDDATLIFRLSEDRGATLKLRPKGADDPEWAGPAEVEIERAVLRPWLFGRDVERWYIDWDGWYVFFPYAPIAALEKRGGADVEVTRYRLIPSRADLATFRKRDRYIGDPPLIEHGYPSAWAYVSHPAIMQRLRGRENGRYTQGKGEGHLWYGASYPRGLEYYDVPKLLIQIASTSADATIDNHNKYVFQAGGRGGGAYGIVPNTKMLSLSLMTGLLNTQALDFYLKHISTVYSGKAYSYSDGFIKQLPIKLALTAEEQRQAAEIAALAEALTTTKAVLRAKQRERADFPGPQTRALPPSYSFYRLEQLAQQSQLPKTFRRAEVSFGQLTLEGKTTARMGRGWLQLPHQALADLAEAWLRMQPRQTVQTSDLLDMRVPANEHGCRLVLEALALLEAEITDLDTQLRADEHRLNQQVEAYYGLDATDHAVIAAFLARF